MQHKTIIVMDSLILYTKLNYSTFASYTLRISIKEQNTIFVQEMKSRSIRDE